MKKIILLIVINFFLISFAQSPKTIVYKGTIDGKMPITMFLKSDANGCTGEIMYQGMYKYNNLSNWLQLNISQNDKNQFVLVEYGFTGVIMLQKTTKGFSGLWISPDSKKQLKVELIKENLDAKALKTFDDKFEKINYNNNDC